MIKRLTRKQFKNYLNYFAVKVSQIKTTEITRYDINVNSTDQTCNLVLVECPTIKEIVIIDSCNVFEFRRKL